MEEIGINENNFGLDRIHIQRLNHIINRYFCDLEENIHKLKNKNSNFDKTVFEIPSYVMVIGEAFKYFIDKPKWLEISYILMEQIKEIIQNGLYGGRISLFSGLADIGLALYIFHKETGYYEKFLNTINQLINKWAEAHIEQYRNSISELKILHYDAIYGLSGVGHYLLLCDNKQSDNLLKILNYLVELSNEHDFYGSKIPNWHIKSENQVREVEKTIFPFGNFNLGLSHGIAGPLVFLSKALVAGYEVKDQRCAINKIVKLYDDFKYENNKGILYWPTQLDFNDYIGCIVKSNYPKRASWCYGNIGISRALYIAATCLEDNDAKAIALQNIERISQLPKEELYLISPILCHGYAGLLSILNITYKETKNESMRKGILNILDILIDCYKEDSMFGYDSMEETDTGEKTIVSENSFLGGTTGVILTLISILKKETNYEKHLLIS